jgi:hypothetical protein
VAKPVAGEVVVIPFPQTDLARGKRFIRPQRLFTVEATVILYSVGKLHSAKLSEALAKTRELFS